MGPPERRQTAAWVLLVAATLLSFRVSAYSGTRTGAIAAIMVIAAVKVIVVLRRFMESDRLAPPLKIYFYLWPFGCAAMILGIAVVSAGREAMIE